MGREEKGERVKAAARFAARRSPPRSKRAPQRLEPPSLESFGRPRCVQRELPLWMDPTRPIMDSRISVSAPISRFPWLVP